MNRQARSAGQDTVARAHQDGRSFPEKTLQPTDHNSTAQLAPPIRHHACAIHQGLGACDQRFN